MGVQQCVRFARYAHSLSIPPINKPDLFIVVVVHVVGIVDVVVVWIVMIMIRL